MGGRIVISFLIGLFIVVFVAAIPMPDYILYGKAYINGVRLLRTDTSIITVELDGLEVDSFTMGDVDDDFYVLRIPMDDNASRPGFAYPGDTIYIYIDDVAINEGPQTVGGFGETVEFDISITVECVNDEECNHLDNDYCDNELVLHDEGICIDNSCTTTTTTTQDCSLLDNNYCDGTKIKRDSYICSSAACVLDSTTTVQDCDNGLYCDGIETCNAASCVAGIAVDCNDGVSCTVDDCNENTDSCDNIPDDSLCDNGLYCDGIETCDVLLDCQSGTAVNCNDGISCTLDSCNENTDSCENTPNDSLCDNWLYCDGVEICDAVLDCQSGDPVDCSDEVSCTIDSCNENTDSCDNIANDALCDNGLYCDGVETCDVVLDCQDGTAVDCNDGVSCTVDSCNENTDSCENNPNDDLCDNGLFCDGTETCDGVLDCQDGTAVNCNDGVDCTIDSCNEATDSCNNIPDDSLCDNGLYCDGIEFCDVIADCQTGTPVDCSSSNIQGIARCDNNPDNNPYTWDYRNSFTSQCTEPWGECTTGDSTITHTCDFTICSAECDDTHNCANTDCDYLDECVGRDYYDYDDVPNLCLSDCTCEQNSCGAPTILTNDPRCAECLSDNDCGFCQKCVNSSCIYQTSSEDLKNECIAGDCASGFCDGAGGCDIEPGTTICRDSTGICDSLEYCDGIDIDCPDDSFLPDTIVCRVAEGDCDITEYCTGNSPNCPTDAVQTNTFECRTSFGICDVAEYCDGLSKDCPVDVFLPDTTECRVAVGGCDIAEYCTGSSADCPTDVVQPNTHICRASAGECDLAENCDGINKDCPVNIYASNGTDCGNDYTEYGCPWGNVFDSDTGMRLHDFSCNGLGSCIENIGVWQVDEVCSAVEFCYFDGNGTGDENYYCRIAETSSIDLVVEWNLISLPVVPINTSINEVLSSIDGNYEAVFVYDAVSDLWLSYDINRPYWLNTLTELDEKHGIWIRMNTSDTILLTGSLPGVTSFELVHGWNQIGYPHINPVLINDSFGSVMSNIDSIFAYNKSYQWWSYDPDVPSFLNTLHEMKPKYGYWIKLKNAANWTLENGVFN